MERRVRRLQGEPLWMSSAAKGPQVVTDLATSQCCYAQGAAAGAAGTRVQSVVRALTEGRRWGPGSPRWQAPPQSTAGWAGLWPAGRRGGQRMLQASGGPGSPCFPLHPGKVVQADPAGRSPSDGALIRDSTLLRSSKGKNMSSRSGLKQASASPGWASSRDAAGESAHTFLLSPRNRTWRRDLRRLRGPQKTQPAAQEKVSIP